MKKQIIFDLNSFQINISIEFKSKYKANQFAFVQKIDLKSTLFENQFTFLLKSIFFPFQIKLPWTSLYSIRIYVEPIKVDHKMYFRFRKLLIYNITFPLLHIQNHSLFIPNLNNDIGRAKKKIRLPKVRFKPNVDFSCFGESLEQLYSTYNFIFDELHVAKLHKKLLSKKSLKG